MQRLLVTSSFQDARRCLLKDGVTKVKQCQRDRDGKGPSRLCPRALVAWQPVLHRLLGGGGETTPPTPFFVTYRRGRTDGPVIPGCWTLRSGSSSQLGLLHTELGQFMASLPAQSGHGQGQSRVWARALTMLRPLLLKQDQQQQQLLSSAHSGLWHESSLIMP